MSATAATAKKQKPLKRHPSKLKQASAYTILTLILISIVAVTFAFPLYWIITGSFKTGAAINSTTPEWWPHEWVLINYQKLFAGKSAPLWQLAIPFSARFSADGEPIYFSVPHRSCCPALDDQHRVHGCCLHDPDLHHRRHGRLCTGQEALCGPSAPVHPDRVRNGSAQAGHSDSPAA